MSTFAATRLMVDTIGADADRLSSSTRLKVAGYVTGSGDVPWSLHDLGRFHDLVKINQDGVDPFLGDVFDVEAGAITPERMAQIAQERHTRRLPTTVYVQRSSLGSARILMQAGMLLGVVNFLVADWNLTEAEAIAMIGGDVIGVQFASPSSNPHTILPGTNLTLAEANCDLSVVLSSWHPPPQAPGPAGVAVARLELDLATGAWRIRSEPGHGRLSDRQAQASVEVQLDVHTGRWRVRPLPWDAKPLGK